jgi:hypothetical protein
MSCPDRNPDPPNDPILETCPRCDSEEAWDPETEECIMCHECDECGELIVGDDSCTECLLAEADRVLDAKKEQRFLG